MSTTLDRSAQIGIAVGITLFFVLVIGSACLGAWKRRSRDKKAKEARGEVWKGTELQKLTREVQALKDAAGLAKKDDAKELSVPMLDEANAVHELNDDPRVLEMKSDSTRAELESGWRGWEASNKV